ncbi:putative pectate lyase C (modular protein) [Candidatus Magnetomoraceae bacterium gMMP-15]
MNPQKLITYKISLIIIIIFIFMIRMPAQAGYVRHVDINGSDITGDGSEVSPFASIQRGIDVSGTGDTLLVHKGIYRENITLYNKNIIIASLYLTTREPDFISQTVIDGNKNGTVITFNNCKDTGMTLIGFTITNGEADSGGGIYCRESNPTLKNLKIINNHAYDSGGGIACNRSSPVLLNSIISDNLTDNHGGGISCGWQSSPMLENVIIVNNSAIGSGGAIESFDSSDFILKHVTISNNSGENAIRCLKNTPTIINSILWNNTSSEIYLSESDPTSITIAYSDIKDGFEGIINKDVIGNSVSWQSSMNIDPGFVYASSGDYHLSNNSPCLGAGMPLMINTDIEGNTRPYPNGSNPDLGAYEDLPVNSPTLSVNPAYETVSFKAGTISFNVANLDTGTMEWTASLNENTSWIKIISENSGINNGTITIDYELNSSEERAAIITIEAPAAKNSPQIVELRQTANRAPIAKNGILKTNEDTEVNNMLSAADLDGDDLAYSIISNGIKGCVTITNNLTGSYIYTPYPDENGSDSFTFKVNDSMIDSNTAMINITINSINDPPVAVAGEDKIVNEWDTVILNGSQSYDVDNEIVAYQWIQTAGPEVTLLNSTSVQTQFKAPDADINGLSLIFQLIVRDKAQLESQKDTIIVNVSNILGDINHKNPIDLYDVILTLKILAGIDANDVYADADINQDGKIGMQELIYVLQVTASSD